MRISVYDCCVDHKHLGTWNLPPHALVDELHNKIDKQFLESQNAKCYTLTKPAFEKATQSKLRNYKVTKKGFLFFAEYYGEA